MMKKGAILIFMVCVFSGVSLAQSSSSVSTAATASIVIYKGLTITNTKGMDFGKVPAGAGLVSILSTNQQAASFEVTGEPDSGVKVTLPATNISLTSGKNVLAMSMYKPVYSTTDNQKTASLASNTDNFGAVLGSKGNLYLWVGGKVNVLPNVPSGTYTGTVSVSVTYTGE